QFTGSGGFSATGAARIVNLGGAAAAVTWGSGSFVPAGSALILGNALADNTVTFANPIDLAAAARTVQADDGAASIDGILSAVLSGTGGGLVKTGTGVLRLAAANTYTGNTTISAGVLTIPANTALPGWNTAGRWTAQAGAALAVDNVFTDADVATLLGTTNFAAGSMVGFDTTTADRAYTAALADTAQGALGVAKVGGNTLTLSATNTFTGPTLVQGGTLLLSANARLSSTGAITVGSGATLNLGGFSQSAGLVTVTNGTLANGTLSSSAGYAVQAGTLSAGLGGTGGLTKTGAGTATLSGTNTFSGALAANTGALQFNGGGSFGSPSAFAASGATLGFAFDGGPGAAGVGGNGTAAPQVVALTAPFTVSADTPITLGRLAGYGTTYAQAANKTLQFGGLSIGGQTLTVTNNNGYGLAFNGTGTLTGSPTFNVATATESNVIQGLSITGPLAGSFGITKTGAGTLVLGGANTFTGDVTVNAGTLSVASDGALGNAANQVSLPFSGAGFRATGSFSTGRTISLPWPYNQTTTTTTFQVSSGNTLTLTAGFANVNSTTQIIKNDNGRLVLAAANPAAWVNGMTVQAGTLRLQNAAALGAATNAVTVSNGWGAGVELAGGISVPNPINLNSSGTGNVYGNAGLGQLVSAAGTNTVTGLVTYSGADAGIGAAAG
ncbi:MAG: hypothetical protein EBX35_13005, partial [Planctomycetia bacterium]|nr:hypothetical protein [Planctomycetia bacterium]